MRAIVQCFLIVFTLLLMSGCAAMTTTQPSALPQYADEIPGQRWRAIRFRIYWPKGQAPDWAVDHLLAHAVVAPVLDGHAKKIALWRFHRRAGRDLAGHQFSFIFYSDSATAESVLRAIQAQPATQQLLAAGFIEKVFEHSAGQAHPERVAATSDQAWTPAMQRNWPVYIMGVSALWLGLIHEHAGEFPMPTDAAGMLGYYRRVEERVTSQWRAEGMHALFHHLSAVFGYEPLPIGGREFRF